jgi:hypothetical protein
MKADLQAFLDNLTTQSKKKKKPKAKPTTSATVHPLYTQQWQHESIIYLVTTTTCACGATSTQTNPLPMLRRYHPRKGIHEEVIQLAPGTASAHILPVATDHRSITIDNCHECITQHTQNPCVQQELF